MLTKILTSALIAGAGAGLIAALLQFIFLQPVLLHAEHYESGQLVHFGATPNSATHPAFVFEPLRDGLSVLFSMLVYAGYALILVACMSLTADMGVVITARTGILWGIGGYLAVQLAPAFSLAPEVPGVAAADVAARQIWWFATVGATGLGLWLIAFASGWIWWAAALALIFAPHVFGAPEPDTLTGPVPPEIAALYASRALGIGIVVWAALGLFAGALWDSDDGEFA